MTDLLAAVNGHRVTRLAPRIPYRGAWSCEADFDSVLPADQLAGAAQVAVGPLTLSGTFDAQHTGTYLQTSKAHIHGGAAKWDTVVEKRSYHDDSDGVSAQMVIEDLASEIGETIGTLSLERPFLGADFDRPAWPASRVLEFVLGATPWWIDITGKTNAGPRPDVEIVGKYEILSVDPRWKVVEIACDDPSIIQIGSILRGRLLTPIVVKDIAINVASGKVRVRCWGTEIGAVAYGRLMRDLFAMVRAAIPELIYMRPHRYRVVEANSGDQRWKLQAVNPSLGLDDILPASVSPGMAGLVAELQPGSIVVVQFVESDFGKWQPMITGHSSPDDPGWLPISVTLDASGSVLVGPSSTLVELGSGSETLAPNKVSGRVVRYGDQILWGQSGVQGPVALQTPASVAKVSA